VRVPEEEAVDVDTPAEFDLAEQIFRHKRIEGIES
jgi:hypothetical protein